MASLSYSAALQSEISRILCGVDYADLKSQQKALIDGTSSASPPTEGCAKRAWDYINRYAQWFALTGSTAAPATWRDWFIARAVMLAAMQIRPESEHAAQYARLERDARLACFESFARKEMDVSPGADTEAWTTHTKNVRFLVISNLIRRKNPQFMPCETIDANLREVLISLWNAHDWNFKRRVTTMTIATNSAVTFPDLSGETFHQPATRKFYYTDSAGAGESIEWADGDQIASWRALNNSTSQTGRPTRFRYENKGGTLTWTFDVTPAQAYTLRGEVYVQGPGTPSSATDTAVFAKFPTEFHPWIYKMTLAECLARIDPTEGARLRARCDEETPALLAVFASNGKADVTQQVRDVYGDHGAVGLGWMGDGSLM